MEIFLAILVEIFAMKVLMIYGSPWRNGNISAMLDVMAEEMRARGMEVDAEYVDELDVKPCMGCMMCRTDKVCCLGEDDAHRIGRNIGSYDLFVIGAPCYWENMPGALKILFDRIVYALIDTEDGRLLPTPLLKGKKAIVVTASTTPAPFNRWFGQTSGVVKSLKAIFRQCGVKLIGSYQKGDTRKSPEPTERDLKKVLKLIP